MASFQSGSYSSCYALLYYPMRCKITKLGLAAGLVGSKHSIVAVTHTCDMEYVVLQECTGTWTDSPVIYLNSTL